MLATPAHTSQKNSQALQKDGIAQQSKGWSRTSVSKPHIMIRLNSTLPATMSMQEKEAVMWLVMLSSCKCQRLFHLVRLQLNELEYCGLLVQARNVIENVRQ